MAEMYLRPIGSTDQYSDHSDWNELPFQREGFEWVDGAPPEGASIYVRVTSI